jgi:hypothetical protein
VPRLIPALLALIGLGLVSSCSPFNPDTPSNPREQSRDRMFEIIDAVNERDADALKNMFTTYSRSEFSEEIDQGIDHIFTVFPDGVVVETEEPNGLPPGESLYGKDGQVASLAKSSYHVTANGEDYWLMFAEFTVNTLDPENVGVYALGVAPRTESEDSPAEDEIFAWMRTFTKMPRETPPGVFIPA